MLESNFVTLVSTTCRDVKLVPVLHSVQLAFLASHWNRQGCVVVHRAIWSRVCAPISLDAQVLCSLEGLSIALLVMHQ